MIDGRKAKMDQPHEKKKLIMKMPLYMVPPAWLAKGYL